MTAKQFSVDLDKAFDEAKGELSVAVRAISLDALSRIVQRTPVATGRARGNWNVSVGQVSPEPPTDELDPGGDKAIAKGQQALASYQLGPGGTAIVISNNLPYINRLENGYSGQAPEGMVAVTAAELQAEVDS